MTRSSISAAIVVAAVMPASVASAQSTLFDQLLNRIKRPAQPSGAIKPASAPSVPVDAVVPTAAQTDAIRRKLTDAATTPAIRQDVTTAAPLLEAAVATMACAVHSTAWRAMNGRRLEPRNYGTLDDDRNFTAMGAMRYHDRSTCVDLSRVVAVTKPALNELVLKLAFVSASSGEASVQDLSFRNVRGEWFLDRLAPWDL